MPWPWAGYISHAIAFFLIALCLFILFDGRSLLVSGLAAAVFGGAVELVQGRVARDSSWSDFVADTVGIMATLFA